LIDDEKLQAFGLIGSGLIGRAAEVAALAGTTDDNG
jgi:hypothetical protein